MGSTQLHNDSANVSANREGVMRRKEWAREKLHDGGIVGKVIDKHSLLLLPLQSLN